MGSLIKGVSAFAKRIRLLSYPWQVLFGLRVRLRLPEGLSGRKALETTLEVFREHFSDARIFARYRDAICLDFEESPGSVWLGLEGVDGEPEPLLLIKLLGKMPWHTGDAEAFVEGIGTVIDSLQKIGFRYASSAAEVTFAPHPLCPSLRLTMEDWSEWDRAEWVRRILSIMNAAPSLMSRSPIKKPPDGR